MNETINITKTIIQKLKDLPPEQQQQILDYVEFISEKYQKNQASTSQERIPGLHKGKIWISDDFNEPMSPEDLLTT